jgi:putative PIN family toxin of toxin-antitoxin system
MNRFFLDTSVLFAAVYSPTGGSARLITDAVGRRIVLVISEDVVEELRDAFGESHPRLLPAVERLLDATPFEFVVATAAQRDAAARIVRDADDAHIVAAAKVSGAEALVTLDKKHLLGDPRIAEFTGMDVITPGDAIARYRR